MLAMAGSLAGSRKNFAAANLESLARSARDFAGAMPDLPNVKAYASVAAESLERLANYVMDSDLETMAGDARKFARAHPMATPAASIAGGLIVTQMIQMRTSPSSRATHPGPAPLRRRKARYDPAPRAWTAAEPGQCLGTRTRLFSLRVPGSARCCSSLRATACGGRMPNSLWRGRSLLSCAAFALARQFSRRSGLPPC
jgi:hypothetical protein